MKGIFNTQNFDRFNFLAIPVVIIWTLSNAGSLFLSYTGMNGYSSRYDPFFEVFRFGNTLGLSNEFNSSIGMKRITVLTMVPMQHKIKAIYRSSDESFVSINDGKETTIVRLHGIYKKSYRLVSLTDTTATFYGFGKNYRLKLGVEGDLPSQERVARMVEDPNQKSLTTHEFGTISRSVLAEEVRDISHLDKNVKVSEQRINGNENVFRIDYINSDSLMGRLGIIQGDIIVSVNNKPLTSYADAISLYNQIPKMRSIRIRVLRNNHPKDIIYEITA